MWMKFLSQFFACLVVQYITMNGGRSGFSTHTRMISFYWDWVELFNTWIFIGPFRIWPPYFQPFTFFMINFVNVIVSGSLQHTISIFQLVYKDDHAHVLEVSLVQPLMLHFVYFWDSQPISLSHLINFREHTWFCSLIYTFDHYLLPGVD